MYSNFELTADPGFEEIHLPRMNQSLLSSHGDAKILHMTGKIFKRNLNTCHRTETQAEMQALGWEEFQVVDLHGSSGCRRRTFWMRGVNYAVFPAQLQHLAEKHGVYLDVVNRRLRQPDLRSSNVHIPFARPGDYQLLVQQRMSHPDEGDLQGIAIGEVDSFDTRAPGDTRLWGHRSARPVTLSQALKVNRNDSSEEWNRIKESWKQQLISDVEELHNADQTWGDVRGDGVLVHGEKLWIFHFGVHHVPFTTEWEKYEEECEVRLQQDKAKDKEALEAFLNGEDWLDHTPL